MFGVLVGKFFSEKQFQGGLIFLQVVEEMFRKCDMEEFELFVGIARRIWFRRNSVIHGGVFIHPNSLLQGAIEADAEFRRANSSDTSIATDGREVHHVKWFPPPEGKYKVNWDAAVDTVNGRLGIGIIVRNHNGLVIAARSRTKMGCLEPVAVEALAAFQAIEFSIELGLQDIILEGDALQVVNALNFSGRCLSRFGQIVADAQMIIASLSSWQIVHSPRETNFAAHGLARAAVKHVIDDIWLEDIPILYL
jgi:ribonuclease HI